MGQDNKKKWFMAVAIISALPVLLYPFVIANMKEVIDGTLSWLLKAFPVYAILTAFFAYKAYDERKEVAWVLIIVLWLSYAAVWLL